MVEGFVPASNRSAPAFLITRSIDMSTTASHHEINIRSASFLIAKRRGVCMRCSESMHLIAVALPRGHLMLEPDAEAWEITALNAFTFYVDYLPDKVGARLQQFSPSYKLGYSRETSDTYWANHCARCASLQSDHDLFCEPGGAFAPISESEAAAIELTKIKEPFEASAAGYAYQTELFEFMRRS
jgi:hypothetical protein